MEQGSRTLSPASIFVLVWKLPLFFTLVTEYLYLVDSTNPAAREFLCKLLFRIVRSNGFSYWVYKGSASTIATSQSVYITSGLTKQMVCSAEIGFAYTILICFQGGSLGEPLVNSKACLIVPVG